MLKTIGLDDSGCQQVTSTLAMAALGAPLLQDSSIEDKPSRLDSEPLKDTESIKPSTFSGHTPQLELKASPDELFGKMSALTRWVVGSDSFRLQFASRQSNGKTVLEKTRVHLPKTNSALRRFILKRLVRKALKKRTVVVAKDPHRKLHLNPVQPRRSQSAALRKPR